MAQDKYVTKAAAFDALWQSVIGLGMLPLLPCILRYCGSDPYFMERDNDTFKNLADNSDNEFTDDCRKVYCTVITQYRILCFINCSIYSLRFCLFGVTDILFKLLFSAIYGLLIAISALPLVL